MVDSLLDRIGGLSDELALGVLQAYVRGLQMAVADGLSASELRDALDEADVKTGEAVTDGEVARQALLMLVATQEGAREGIEALLDGPRPDRFLVAEVATLVLAAAVLQTAVTIERSSTGRMRVRIEKRAAGIDEVRAFLGAFATWLRRGGP